MADGDPMEYGLTTASEVPTMEAFRKELSKDFEGLGHRPELTAEPRLLRFLRGYEHDIPAAAAAYRAMLKWRKEVNADRFSEALQSNGYDIGAAPHTEAVMKCAVVKWDAGRSPSGDIVQLTWPGQWNTTMLLETTTAEQFIEHMSYIMERTAMVLDEESVKQNRLVKCIRIQNMSGLGIFALSGGVKDRLGMMMKIAQECYPESLRFVAVVNPPSFFHAIYALIKPFLKPKTVKRVQIISGDYRAQLAKDVDASTLQELVKNEADQPGVAAPGSGMSVSVPAWGKIEVPLPVSAGQKVTWDFTANGAVVFTVTALYSGADGTTVAVPPESKTSDSGSCTATDDGIISVVFDNSAAWMFSSSVTYSVNVARAGRSCA